MKRRTTTWIFSLAMLGVMIMFTNGCKKSSDSSSTTVAITDADGNVYHTVTIGTQVWMVENLKTTKYNDGTSIPLVSDTSWTNLTTAAYCWYNNDASWKPIYGALYNWYAVNSGILAPKGFHIATRAEWATLIAYLGGDTLAGGKLKSTGTVEAITGLWLSPNKGATNSSGFTAYPGGYRSVAFQWINSFGYWWTATINGTSTAWDCWMRFDNTDVYTEYSLKTNGYCVRCVKD